MRVLCEKLRGKEALMRRKKKLYAMMVAALTMIGGLGTRTLAAVPSDTAAPGRNGYDDTGQNLSTESGGEEISLETGAEPGSDTGAEKKSDFEAGNPSEQAGETGKSNIKVVIHGIPEETQASGPSSAGIKKEAAPAASNPEEGTDKTVKKTVSVEAPVKTEKTVRERIEYQVVTVDTVEQKENTPTNGTKAAETIEEKNGDKDGAKAEEKTKTEAKNKTEVKTNVPAEGLKSEKAAVQTIQRDKPQIRIDGIRDRATSASPVDLSAHIKSRDLTAADIHAAVRNAEGGKAFEGKVAKNQDGYNVTFPKVSDDGLYQMVVRTRDGQGHVNSEKKVSFTVNRRGSAACLATENPAGRKVNYSVRPEFAVAGVDENAGLRVTVNGHPVGASYNKEGRLVLDRALTRDGRYVVRVEGKDGAGREIRSEPVEFVIDRTGSHTAKRKQCLRSSSMHRTQKIQVRRKGPRGMIALCVAGAALMGAFLLLRWAHEL